jgi:hypothetical protein
VKRQKTELFDVVDPNRREFLKTGAAVVAARRPRLAVIFSRRRNSGARVLARRLSRPSAWVLSAWARGERPRPSHAHSRLPRDGRLRHPIERTDARSDHRRRSSGAEVYNKGPRDFERLYGSEDLDLVHGHPWEWHVPVLLAAMRNSKHGSTEVPAAMSLDDCWAMVRRPKCRKHCLLENCLTAWR